MHMYSKQIAEALNPRMPDVAASSVLYNLSLWQRNNYKQLLLDGKRHSFRSVSQIKTDQPYLTRSAIHACIERLEEKLGEEFIVRRDKDVLHYHIGEATMKRLARSTKKCERDTLMSFYVEDAVKHSIRPAVILQNLDYATLNFTTPVRDADGKAYAELNSTKLSNAVGYSTDTIQRALSSLREENVLIPHPTKPGFYRRAEPRVDALVNAPAVPADVNSTPAEMNTQPANVDDGAANVDAASLGHELKPLILQDPGPFLGLSVSTPFINEDGELCSKDCYNSFPFGEADLPQKTHAKDDAKINQNEKHPVMQKLEAIVDANITKLREKGKFGSVQIVVPDTLELPYECITGVNVEDTQVYDSSERARRDSDVECMVENAIAIWKEEYGMIIDDEDRKKLAVLFRANWSRIDEGHLLGLYGTMLDGEITNPDKPPRPWTTRILQKVKTPKQFLRYLPQILTQVYGVEEREDFPDEWAGFDFSYLERLPKSSLVDFGDRVEVEFVDQDFALIESNGKSVRYDDAT